MLSLALTTGVVAPTASAGPSGGALPPVLIEALDVTDGTGVPEDAEIVAINVTAVEPAADGFLTVWPCDQPRPTTSNVNYTTDQIVPNLVLSRLDEGFVCIYTLAVADIVVDVVGYTPAGSALTPLPAPARVIDTRDTDPEPVPAGASVPVQIGGTANVPGAEVAVFNLTAIAGDLPGFLTVYPCDEPRPPTSSVNYAAGSIVPNLVTSRLAADGTVCVYAHTAADFIVDVAAYAQSGIETLEAPVRIIDSREDGPVLPAGNTMEVDITGRADVPDDATAAVYNLTSTESVAAGFATSYPCDEPRPFASNLNHAAGQNVANGAISKLSADGRLCVYHLAPTHLIVDLIGYTRSTADYVPVTPTRIWDTREGWQRTCDWIVVPATNAAFRLGDVVAYNLRTGEMVRQSLPDGVAVLAAQHDAHPIINAECDGILHYSGGRLYELDFDGTQTDAAVPGLDDVAPVNMPGALEVLDDDRVVHVHDSVTDVRSGSVIGHGQPSLIQEDGTSWYRTDVSIDEGANIVAAAYNDGTASRTLVRVMTTAGTPISEWPLDLNAISIDVSPDGWYLLINTFSIDGFDPIEDFPGETESPGATLVFTIFGGLVDLAAGYEVDPEAVFTGTGEIAACVGGAGLFTFDLFGPVERIEPFGSEFWQQDPYCRLGS